MDNYAHLAHLAIEPRHRGVRCPGARSLLKYLKIAFVWQLFGFFRRSFLLIIAEHKWWQKSHSHFCLDDFTPEQGNAQVQMPVFKCILKRGKRGQTHFGLYQARLCILSPTYRLYVA